MGWRNKPIEACVEGAEHKSLAPYYLRFSALPLYFAYDYYRSPLRKQP